MKTSKKSRGFTLVELLIVITIIGILSGSLMLTMSAGTDKAEATRIVTDLNSLKLAAGLYYADNVGNTMEPSISEFKTYVSAPEKLDNDSLYDFQNNEETGEWFVGYKIETATKGVRDSLKKMAESTGLRNGTTSSDDSDVYDGGTSGVYLRVR